MAKQIITLEITFKPGEVGHAHPLRTWVASKLTAISWVKKAEILTASPVRWEEDDDPDDPEWRKAHLSDLWTELDIHG